MAGWNYQLNGHESEQNLEDARKDREAHVSHSPLGSQSLGQIERMEQQQPRYPHPNFRACML